MGTPHQNQQAHANQQQQQQQQQQSNSNNNNNNNNSISFHHVSKFFNLPLSDAAHSLGVSHSSLKKICHDNGLVRWPYRKFLLGKSIDDILKEAAQATKMDSPATAAAELSISKATNLVTSDVTNISSPTVGSAFQSKTIFPGHDISKARSITQQLGLKTMQNENPAIVDEFKYGFPSHGLSRTSNKWWGSSTNDIKEDNRAKKNEDIKQSEEPIDYSPNKDKGDSGSGKDESNKLLELTGTDLLLAVRKRAVDEGREAFRLGVHRCSGIKKPGKREQRLLMGILGSSLSKEWGDVSS